MKRIETQVDLPAVPSVVWAQLMDTASIGSWNPFITSLSGVLEVGERLEVRDRARGRTADDVQAAGDRRRARLGAWNGSAPWAFPASSTVGTPSR